MLDERTEAILLEAMSTLSGGETVAVTRYDGTTTLSAAGLVVSVKSATAPGTISGDLTAECDCCGEVAPGAPGAGGASHLCNQCGGARVGTGDLAPDDALLAVQVFDAYLTIASHIQEMPGAVAMNDETRGRIKTVREKLRGMI
jgi:hypothetical protein